MVVDCQPYAPAAFYPLSRPQGHSAIGRIFISMKNPLTLAGIEPATFRFVAQHLNHCTTAVPLCDIHQMKLKKLIMYTECLSVVKCVCECMCKHFRISLKPFICTTIAHKLSSSTSTAVTEDDQPSAMIYNELHRAEFLVRD